MPDQLQLRGGTTTEHNSFTGALREVTVDTTKKTLVVHDGATAGGTALMKESGATAASSITLGTGGSTAVTIDSNQNVGIGIASPNNTTKLHIATTQSGTASGTGLTMSGWNGTAEARVQLMSFGVGGGTFAIRSGTGNTERLRIDQSGNVGIGTSSPAKKLDVSGQLRATAIFSTAATSSAASANQAVFDYNTSDTRILSYNSSGSSINLFTNPNGGSLTSRLSIKPSGNVGIGTTSPDFPLEIVFTNNNSSSFSTSLAMGSGANADLYALHLQNLGTGNCESGLLLSAGNTQFGQWSVNCLKTGAFVGDLAFRTRTGSGTSAERMRIDSSGSLLMGTTSSAGFDSFGSNSGGIILDNVNSSNTLLLATHDTVKFFYGADASHAYLWCGSNHPIRIATNNAERMRIGPTGTISAGTTYEGVNTRFSIEPSVSGSNSMGMKFYARADVYNVTHIQFEHAVNNQIMGNITSSNAGSVSYNTSSDYRLKENIVAISDGITRLKTLQPKRFNFIIDETNTLVDGFLAHEVTAVPEAITGTKDEVDSDNKPVYQGIDQSKLVPLLVAAVQELIGKVEALEAA